MSGFSLQKYINDYYTARDNLDIANVKYSILDGLLTDIENSEILSNANAINDFNTSIVPAFVILKNNLLADSTSAINDYANKTTAHKNTVNFYNYQIAYVNKIINYRNTSLLADRITEYNSINSQIGSQIILINSQNVNLTDMLAYLTSVYNSKTTINANIQNRNLLLQCIPSNNYRYPTSGVGLIKYLHANLSHSGLAEKLQTEFKDDKVEIINAAFNSYSGDLELDLDFSEADAGV